MTARVPAEPASDASHRATVRRLLINVFTAHDTAVVHVAGELDLATRNQLVSAVTTGHQPETLIDLGGVTFMDCSGYGSLAASRRILEGQGRSLTITGQTGQPARLLGLIAEFEKCPLRSARPARVHRKVASRDLGGRRPDGSVGVPVVIHAN